MSKKPTKKEVVEEKENPIAKFKSVHFVCSRWPYLALGGGIKFAKGHLIAESQKVVDRVRRADGFGSAIIEVKERIGRKPTVEESAEMAALEELQRLEPRAHRGAVGTTNIGQG